MTSRAAASREGATRRSTGPRGTLRIIEQRVYRGPNYWSYEPTIKLIVDLGQLEDYPTNKIDGFTDRLLAIVPGVGLPTRAGPGDRAASRDGCGKARGWATWPSTSPSSSSATRGPRWAGARPAQPVRRAATTSSSRTPRRRSGWRPAASPFVSSTTWSRPSPAFDFRAEFEQLIRLAERAAFGPSTQAILDEAGLRDIPWIRLSEGSLVQLGHGLHQKRIRATMTSQTEPWASTSPRTRSSPIASWPPREFRSPAPRSCAGWRRRRPRRRGSATRWP